MWVPMCKELALGDSVVASEIGDDQMCVGSVAVGG